MGGGCGTDETPSSNLLKNRLQGLQNQLRQKKNKENKHNATTNLLLAQPTNQMNTQNNKGTKLQISSCTVLSHTPSDLPACSQQQHPRELLWTKITKISTGWTTWERNAATDNSLPAPIRAEVTDARKWSDLTSGKQEEDRCSTPAFACVILSQWLAGTATQGKVTRTNNYILIQYIMFLINAAFYLMTWNISVWQVYKIEEKCCCDNAGGIINTATALMN